MDIMRLFKSKIIRLLLQILLFIIIFILILKWQQRDMLENQTNVNPTTLQTLEGQRKTLFNNRQKSKKLVYFFAPWCSICRISMPKLNYLNRESLEIYAVALSYDSKKQVQSFISDIEYEGEVLLGDSEISKQFRVSVFPAYYVINEDNKITHKGLGMVSIINIWWQTL